MKSHVLADNMCPTCGKAINRAASAPNEPEPTIGDMGVCVYCGVPLVVAEGGKLRAATVTDLDALSPEEALKLGTISAAAVRAGGRGGN